MTGDLFDPTPEPQKREAKIRKPVLLKSADGSKYYQEACPGCGFPHCRDSWFRGCQRCGERVCRVCMGEKETVCRPCQVRADPSLGPAPIHYPEAVKWEQRAEARNAK